VNTLSGLKKYCISGLPRGLPSSERPEALDEDRTCQADGESDMFESLFLPAGLTVVAAASLFGTPSLLSRRTRDMDMAQQTSRRDWIPHGWMDPLLQP
jgi:hypothetical protein